MEEKIKQFVKQLNEKYPEYVASYTQGKKFYKIWRTFGAQKCIYCLVKYSSQMLIFLIYFN